MHLHTNPLCTVDGAINFFVAPSMLCKVCVCGHTQTFPLSLSLWNAMVTYRWHNPKLWFSKKKWTPNSLQYIAILN